jgi:phospholipid transport system substrate-binding protein
MLACRLLGGHGGSRIDPRASGRTVADRRSRDVKRTNLVVAMVLSFAVSIAGAVGVAHAGPATDVVKAKQTTLFELLQKPSNEKKVAEIFDQMLDYQTLAEGSLGSEWAARSDAEKAEFSELLKQLVRKAYERNLKKTLGFNVEYVSETPKGNAIVVSTKAVSKKNAREEPVEIKYVMAEKKGAWVVQDIITEDVSLVSSYRSQFTKIVKKDGFPTLIKKMKDKLAKGDV